MNPYDQLGIDADADDAAIRQAYLECVKRYPPERYPERFAAVNKAYEALKTEERRMEYRLFNQDPGAASPMAAVHDHFKAQARRTPPDMHTFKEFLRGCLFSKR